MQIFSSRTDPGVVAALQKRGGLGIILTDTLYGLVVRAEDPVAVERLYSVKAREAGKPCIVLIGSIDQIWDRADAEMFREDLERFWPGPVSVILPTSRQTPPQVTRGGNTVAFRLPADPELQHLLRMTGPLLAPSANPAGLPPAADIASVRDYFEDAIDFCVDNGAIPTDRPPSRLIRLEGNGTITTLR